MNDQETRQKMKQEKIQRRLDLKAKHDASREFTRVRKAALEVAAYTHKDKPEVVSAQEAVNRAERAVADAKASLPILRQVVLEANQKRIKCLEQYIPKKLRQVLKV